MKQVNKQRGALKSRPSCYILYLFFRQDGCISSPLRKNTASNLVRIHDKIHLMKYTQYFSYMIQRPDRTVIKEEWIAKTIKEHVKTVTQSDGRIRKWRFIEETGKHLRVILFGRRRNCT